MLDRIICPEWEFRYYSFDANWGAHQQLASMRDGQGDQYFCLFNQFGAILKGFAHEAPMSPWRVNPPKIWPGILENVPEQFRPFLSEPAFAIEETTFCIWRTFSDESWQIGDIHFPSGQSPDGSADLLSQLNGIPATYQKWAEAYYDRPVNIDAVKAIYRHDPLTETIIRSLNPDLVLEDLHSDIAEIGY